MMYSNMNEHHSYMSLMDTQGKGAVITAAEYVSV